MLKEMNEREYEHPEHIDRVKIGLDSCLDMFRNMDDNILQQMDDE
jgi:hypothetical protein